ncbi:MAG TPA: hypothetical protein PLI53_06080 [Geobacteraceae bacterium]|nr:hypothetical protein [Geobacteraceae bacterium]
MGKNGFNRYTLTMKSNKHAAHEILQYVDMIHIFITKGKHVNLLNRSLDSFLYFEGGRTRQLIFSFSKGGLRGISTAAAIEKARLNI